MEDGGVVLVGGGIGAVSVARRLRETGYDGLLTLVSDEDVAPYDRPPLSKQFLAGALGVDDVGLFRADELAGLEVTLRTGHVATGLSIERRELELDTGERISYRILVVATGARARRLTSASDLGGVHYLRSLADAERLAGDLLPGRRVVIVGAGFIGLEVAATAQGLGASVTVLETASQPLTRVLGPSAGSLVTALHADRIDLRCGVASIELVGDGHVQAVRADGEELPADTVVVGIGAIPNTEWLDGSGLRIEDGVICDDGGRTSAPDVYALGDAACWRNGRTGVEQRVEQWQSAVEQAAVVAANVATDLGVSGIAPATWDSVPYFWSDQYDHKIQFCGRPGEVSLHREVRRGVVACFADTTEGRATGVLAIDNPAALARGRRMVASDARWPDMVEWLESL